jgi:hypothetical protein
MVSRIARVLSSSSDHNQYGANSGMSSLQGYIEGLLSSLFCPPPRVLLAAWSTYLIKLSVTVDIVLRNAPVMPS